MTSGTYSLLEAQFVSVVGFRNDELHTISGPDVVLSTAFPRTPCIYFQENVPGDSAGPMQPCMNHKGALADRYRINKCTR